MNTNIGAATASGSRTPSHASAAIVAPAASNTPVLTPIRRSRPMRGSARRASAVPANTPRLTSPRYTLYDRSLSPIASTNTNALPARKANRPDHAPAIRQHEADVAPRPEHAPPVAEHDPRVERRRVGLAERLRQPEAHRDPQQHAVERDEGEVRAPAEANVKLRSQDRRHHRRDAEHQHHRREHARRPFACVQVAHHRARHDRDGRHPQRLREPRRDQRADVLCEPARHRRQRVHDERPQQRRSTPEAVRDRSGEELRRAQPNMYTEIVSCT